MLEEAGFVEIRLMYNTFSWSCTTEGVFKVSLYFDPYKSIWNGLTEDKKKLVYNTYITVQIIHNYSTNWEIISITY